MKTRTFKTLVGLNFALVAALAGGLILDASIAKDEIDDIGAIEGNYVLTFDSNNKIYAGSYAGTGSKTVSTSSGNSVTFNYNDIKKAPSDNQWQSIVSKGDFSNGTKISGIEQIVIDVEGTHQFEVRYSYFANFSEYEVKTYSANATTDHYVINFDTMKPNYFKIMNIASSNLVINSLKIYYSCTDSSIGENKPVTNENYSFGYYPQSEVDAREDADLYQQLLDVENNPSAYPLVGNYIAFGGDLYLPLEKEETKHYFKVEPVEWIVLEEKTNEQYIFITDKLLDGGVYDEGTDVLEGKYQSDYDSSGIRAWLNDTMYDTLFNEDDKERVVLNVTDNSSDTTRSIFEGPDPNPYAPIDNPTTEDHVYLPSYADFDGTYGYDNLDSPSERICYATDYVRLTNPSIGESNAQLVSTSYWTRSPNNENSNNVSYVNAAGSLLGGTNANNFNAVRVMITFTLAN